MDERVIGRNIRRLRQKTGLTVTAAAQAAELTKSTLSKIETGQVSSPVSTLIRIAEALKVPLADFFVEPHIPPRYVLTRKGQGQTITRDGSRFGYSYEALALEMPGKPVEPFVLTICPGDPVGSFRHGGQEMIYMLEGRLRVTVGQEAMVLRPGDSLYFDPNQEHTTEVVGKRPARFLCLFVHTGRSTSRDRQRADLM